MGNEPNTSQSFDWAVWSRVWRDIKTVAEARLRLAIEGIVLYGVAYIFLSLFGSKDAAFDFTIEKALAVPVVLAIMMLFHLLWTWARAPRGIYYEQQEELCDSPPLSDSGGGRIMVSEGGPKDECVEAGSVGQAATVL